MRNTKILIALQGKINTAWHYTENYHAKKKKTKQRKINNKSSTNDTDNRSTRKNTLNIIENSIQYVQKVKRKIKNVKWRQRRHKKRP